MQEPSGAESLIIIVMFFGILLFSAFIMYKIGKKFEVKKSFWWYIIPVYNMWLVMKPVGLSPWLLLGIFIPYVNIVIGGYVWGQIAKNLGKNEWLYGITIAIIGLPVFILAFDSSKWIESSGSESNYPNKDELIVELSPEEYGLPVIKLKDFETITVGRERSNEISIENQYLSSKHIDIYAQSGEIFVTDLGTNDRGSTNGTYIDGKKLTPSHPTKLNRGERLILGSEDVVYALR
jgi:hypothetical protein